MSMHMKLTLYVPAFRKISRQKRFLDVHYVDVFLCIPYFFTQDDIINAMIMPEI